MHYRLVTPLFLKESLYSENKSTTQNGAVFKMGKVNLDALIPREDFEYKEESSQSDTSNNSPTLKLSDLEIKDTFFYPVLRKPDFQRETNEWIPNKIFGLINSFVSQDLIPAIIMWNQKGSFTFVIDGGHRLSALIAWVNDDYGDGQISRNFFETIPEEQRKIADNVRKRVDSEIGSYITYKNAVSSPKGLDEKLVQKARDLSRHTLQLQWVKGDAKKAEESFFRINQEASKINKTELTLLKSREYPNGIASRAIKNSGMGHKYWQHFDIETQKEIEKTAKEISELIFIPPYKKPVDSLELPIAGKSNSAIALPLILNFVNIVNGALEKENEKDEDGNITLAYLKRCKEIAQKINSKESSSLGLLPLLYFYSEYGDYRTPSFYAIVALLLKFEKDKTLQTNFIKVRKDFEKIILEYGESIYQISRRYREGIKGYSHITNFYIEIIKKLLERKPKKEFIKELLDREKLKVISSPKEFSLNIKSSVFISEAIKKALKCKICGGLIYSKSITIDHIKRKSEDGLGTIDNAQIAHPYCNTTYKN